jgi:EmrB/QacA subfamily drug resistance transporter
VGRNPWTAASVVLVGSVMVALDATIVNVALHSIAVDLGAEQGVSWIATSYLLGACAAQPATGWLADRFGRKQLFLSALAVFTLASAACALSPNLGALIGFRLVQGLAGGVLPPTGMAIMMALFPRRRLGRAMGVWSMAFMMSPAIGPSVGGLIVTSASWHWMFLVNVPIGIGSFLVGLRLIPSVGHRERRPFDTPGLILGSGGLALAALGLSEGNSWGWQSGRTIAALVIGGLALSGFVVRELRTRHPMIELRMFSHRSFSLSMGAMLFVTMAQFGRLVFIPLQLEKLRGFSALRIGLLLAPPALAGVAGSFFGGRFADKIGPRRPMMIGCAVAAIALFGMAHLTLTTSLLWIMVLLSIQSIGMGLVTAPAMVAGLRTLPSKLVAQGSALRSLTAQVAGALAVAVFGAVVATRAGAHPSPEHAQAAYNAAFLVASLGAVLALALSAALVDRTVEQDEHDEQVERDERDERDEQDEHVSLVDFAGQ